MSEVASKWGEAVAGRGFAQIPNYLLLLNQFLDEDSKLSPIELLVLFQLAGAWWSKDKQPFPSMKTLAVRCGASERQVQRSINRLVAEGMLARVKRRSKGIIASNAYDMSPLVDFLVRVARAFPNGYPRKVDQRIRALSKGTALALTNLADSLADLEEENSVVTTASAQVDFANIDWGEDEEDEKESFVTVSNST